MKGFGEPSRHQTRRWLWMTVPIAVLLGPISVSWARAVFKTWMSGETLTAADLNANFEALRQAIAGRQVVTLAFDAPAVATGEYPTVSSTVACPEGTLVTGGGCAVDNAEWSTYATEPFGNGWICRFKSIGTLLNDDPNGGQGTVAAQGRVHAICAGGL